LEMRDQESRLRLLLYKECLFRNMGPIDAVK
jgi:hypothetical protein